MRIALELAQHKNAYDDMATKFFEHFLYIAQAMTDMGGRGVGLWDEEDSFYYDVLNLSERPDFAVAGPLIGRFDPTVCGRDSGS